MSERSRPITPRRPTRRDRLELCPPKVSPEIKRCVRFPISKLIGAPGAVDATKIPAAVFAFAFAAVSLIMRFILQSNYINQYRIIKFALLACASIWVFGGENRKFLGRIRIAIRSHISSVCLGRLPPYYYIMFYY